MSSNTFEPTRTAGVGMRVAPADGTVRPAAALSGDDTEATRSALAAAWDQLEDYLARWSDWLNPILVKETRQALKSWQFSLTFVLLLVACWIVTIAGVAYIGPSIYYAASGGEMLGWYYLILSLPLLVVVPFAAFRSLAAEREDNTYDLLSITTLRPRQIIGGKLGSAVVQMAVYFSAITPCLAFTYLLRGVDVPTIVLLLALTFFTSLALSMIGLLLATLTRQRYSQLVLSVGFVALLLVIFGTWQQLAAELVQSGYTLFDDEEFWIGMLAVANLYVTTFALAYFAAAGMITFSSENRSTPLRIVMLVQQVSWIGWMGYVWIVENYEPAVALVAAICGGVYWYVAGTMLTAERPDMPRRVMRRLPQSVLGRALLTWFNPGPSSGYMFAIANLTTLVLLAFVVAASSQSAFTFIGGGLGLFGFVQVLTIGWSYVVAYLGLGCLATALLRRLAVVSMVAGVLIHLIVLLAATGIPTSIQWMSVELRDTPYSYLQITNPFWTMIYLLQSGPTPELDVLSIVVPAAAICMLLLNMPGLVRELRRVRVALPTRVAEDEAELHPLPEEGPTNPWEEEESGIRSRESGNSN